MTLDITGIHASGVQPSYTGGLGLGAMTKMMNFMYEHPVGGHVDFKHLVRCGDSSVCLADPTSTGDPEWEALRRTPPGDLSHGQPLVTRPSRVLMKLDKPITETQVYSVSPNNVIQAPVHDFKVVVVHPDPLKYTKWF